MSAYHGPFGRLYAQLDAGLPIYKKPHAARVACLPVSPETSSKMNHALFKDVIQEIHRMVEHGAIEDNRQNGICSLFERCVTTQMTGRQFYEKYGCTPVKATTDVLMWLRKKFIKWPEYSGNVSCPIQVSYPNGRTSAHFQQYVDHQFHNGWNRDRPYSAARWRLLHFVLDEADKELDNVD